MNCAHVSHMLAIYSAALGFVLGLIVGIRLKGKR